jgi:hypothetical protein
MMLMIQQQSSKVVVSAAGVFEKSVNTKTLM